MKLKQSENNIPRNVIILALAVTAILGIFRLIAFLILVWIVALAFITVYQYSASKRQGKNFVCLECATIHQQVSCPKCGSKLKKFYSGTNKYGI